MSSQRVKQKSREWYKKHNTPEFREKERKRLRELHKEQRLLVLSMYSKRTGDSGEPRCSCCGEGILQFLEIDHIKGGGNKHRKQLPNDRIESWLIRNNFPDGYQTLCCNCNKGKHLNGGKCPHDE